MTILAWLRIIYAAFLLVTTAIGWRWGGRSDRWGVAIMVAASLATAAVMSTPFFNWRSRLGPLIAVDMLALVALLVLTLKTARFWPIWATSLHLIALGTHGAAHILPISLRQTYPLPQGFWAYPMMLCIIGGAISRRRKAVSERQIGRPAPAGRSFARALAPALRLTMHGAAACVAGGKYFDRGRGAYRDTRPLTGTSGLAFRPRWIGAGRRRS